MSGPFAVGDVVVRVKRSPYGMPLGTIVRVEAVADGWYNGKPSQALHFANWPHRPLVAGWEHSSFRHLPRADDTFTAEMRACRPVREEVQA